jgi:hypothetical protein
MRTPRVRLPWVSPTAPTGPANGQVDSADDPGSRGTIYSEQAADPVYGTARYTPDRCFEGMNIFTSTATDGQDESKSATQGT